MAEHNNRNSIEHNYENRYTDRFLKYLTKVMVEGKISDRSLSASLHKANNYITRIRNRQIRLTFPIMCEIAEVLEQPLEVFFQENPREPQLEHLREKVYRYGGKKLPILEDIFNLTDKLLFGEDNNP